jgi:hypothetical protein
MTTEAPFGVHHKTSPEYDSETARPRFLSVFKSAGFAGASRLLPPARRCGSHGELNFYGHRKIAGI